jgi:hypothetical protein
MNCRI